MLKSDVVSFFGTNTRVAVIAGVDPSAVSQWKELVPERAAQRLAEASGGALHYDKGVYDRHRQSRRKAGKNTPSIQKESD